jgi:hypothetical protein
MKQKPTIPLPVGRAQPYVMGIADKLSDDPMLLQLLGRRFKVIVDYDTAAKRVTYSFRRPDDSEPDEQGAKSV